MHYTARCSRAEVQQIALAVGCKQSLTLLSLKWCGYSWGFLERDQASKIAENSQGKGRSESVKTTLLLTVGQISPAGRRELGWGSRTPRRRKHSYGCTMNAREKGEHPLTEVSRSGSYCPFVLYRQGERLFPWLKVASSFRKLRWMCKVTWTTWQEPLCPLMPCSLSTFRLWECTSWKTTSINASFLSFSADRIEEKTEEKPELEKMGQSRRNRRWRKLAHTILTGKHDTVGVSMKKIDMWFQKEQSTWIGLVPERSEHQIPLGLVYTCKLTDTATGG